MSAPADDVKKAKTAQIAGTGGALGVAAILAMALRATMSMPKVAWGGTVIAVGVILCALLGTPLFVIMGGATELGWMNDDKPLRYIGEAVLNEHFAHSKILVTIPLYTFVGYLLAESKTPDRLVHAARAVLGWLPGGLAIVCVIASAVFTLLTGGSGVTIIAIGGLLYPALRKQNYSDKFSLGLVTTGGSVGLLLPLSLPLIVYATVAKVDIEKSFKAVLLPGAIVIVLLSLYSAYVSTKEKVKREPPRMDEIGRALWALKWELLIPVILVGGMLTGLAEIHEIAGLLAAYVLITQVWIHKDLDWKKDVLRIVKASMSLAGAIVIILAMANALMNYAIVHQIPMKVLAFMKEMGIDQRWQLLIVLNLFLLVLGMLMEGFSAILVAVPLVLPLVAQLGRDHPEQAMSPFQLAMIFLLNLELAFCLPPLGLNLFIASFRFNRPVTSLYKVVLPFVGILTIALVLVSYVPAISTFAIQGDIAAERGKANGQVRLGGMKDTEPRPDDKDDKKLVEAADREMTATIQPKLDALGVCYRDTLQRAPWFNGGMLDVAASIDGAGAVSVASCGMKLEGKPETSAEATALCACVQQKIATWKLPGKEAKAPFKNVVVTLFLEAPRSPTEAWSLECVQEDTLSPKPCSLKDIETYGRDGKKSTFVPRPGSDKPSTSPEETPDAGGDGAIDFDNDDLEKQFMSAGDAGAAPKADAAPAHVETDDERMEREFMEAGSK